MDGYPTHAEAVIGTPKTLEDVAVRPFM